MACLRSGGAKHILINYNTTAGAISTVAIHLFKIDCYADPARGRMQVDHAATTGGKQTMSLQCRRVLICKTIIHAEFVLTPEKCTATADPKIRDQWIVNTVSQLD